MECNKDEAVKAKEIAERKLTEKDIAGAQKFALKARNLFPDLDGLSQFLEVVNVYVAYEKKINGEVDFYGILSVDPSADDETIRKHYRRLALALHPDKNQSVGADGAFKILSEAWSLLSDRTKKMVYDYKRGMRNVSMGNSSMQGNQHGFHNFPMNPASARNSTNANVQPTPVAPQPSKRETFWTSCNRCQIRYEYLKLYLNKSLMCPNCHQPFLAGEVSAPVNNQASSFPWSSSQQQQRTSNRAANGSSASGVKLPTALNSGQTGYSGFGATVRADIQQDPVLKTRGANGVQSKTTTVMQAAQRGRPAGENLKRAHAEAASVKTDVGFVPDSTSSFSKVDRVIKKRRMAELKSNCQRKGKVNEMAGKVGSSSQRNIHGNENGVLRAERVAVAGSNKPRSSRELSNSEIRNMLVKKARMEISKKLKEWSTATASKTSYKEEKEVEKKKQAPKVITNDMRKDKTANDAVVDSKIACEQKRSSVLIAAVDLEPEVMSMTVPDPDFHNFDKDRTEKSFDDYQVWAAYDDDDGMPRYYALIHNVISKKPFKVQFSWLNSKNNSEFGPINWIDSGFLKTSGDFRIGKHEISKTLNSFSHKVKWVKGARGVIQIYPRKGDVWAVYRHWSPKWNELTPDDVIHTYDMVEVLGDYTEKEGVTVAPLVKVAGFKSVFRQHLDPKYIRHIPREEMFRFSHQVPSYLLTGQEAPNVPTGCWELDPAALPLELLKVMTEAEIEAERKAADPSNLERTCSESKEEEKSYVVGNSNVIKGEETTRDSKYDVKKPILTYSRKKKVKKAEASNIDAKRETS
ncbi:uncharacterized protein LOC107813853 [Nicotiana tabacum]|uniref:Uncharacterized protein LOC107813853 n=2 Tax=Nicotiana TaxID=4085 RepID=A0A1S4C0G8_TOBAC|nr:PREDICTED: uncharacterized protein LOC104232145 [Nicotiana sylvestris]XP_009783566.1 PREDICTED: uncharacterized protein LOC104232145 [Nicotiana sylvestris]XP_016494647.1 PREDICTED: uncharacterized protein LOC107813853 [Nicotiana tabacum]